jgi:hypothetical protein
MHRRRTGKRVFQPRDGLSKGGDTAAAAGAQGWLHESKLGRNENGAMQSKVGTNNEHVNWEKPPMMKIISVFQQLIINI